MNKLITCFPTFKITFRFLILNKQKGRICVPGGEMVLSSVEGIVISITGLLDGKPFSES